MRNPHGFQKGKSGNPQGRPVGSKQSESKRTLRKLRQFEEKALENIRKSVEGEIVDKDSLTTSKWVVTTIITVQKSVADEEKAIKENPALAEDTPQAEASPKRYDLTLVQV